MSLTSPTRHEPSPARRRICREGKGLGEVMTLKGHEYCQFNKGCVVRSKIINGVLVSCLLGFCCVLICVASFAVVEEDSEGSTV